MAEATEERVRQTLADDDPGLVTEAKVIAAVQRIVELGHPLRVVALAPAPAETTAATATSTSP